MKRYWFPVTDFNRHHDRDAMEAFLAFSILTAGRRNDRASDALEHLLHDIKPGTSPLTHIGQLHRSGKLYTRLDETGLGFQGQKTTGLASAAAYATKHDLRDTTVEELDQKVIAYVGRKTARFWAMHSRPNQRYAALDVHLLRFMADYQKAMRIKTPVFIPDRTPDGQAYTQLETLYLDICDRHSRDPSTFDFRIWEAYAQATRGDDTARKALLRELTSDRAARRRPLALPSKLVAPRRETRPVRRASAPKRQAA